MGFERAIFRAATGLCLLHALPGVAQRTPAPPSEATAKLARQSLAGASASLQTVAVPRGARAEARGRPANGPLTIGALSAFELRYPGTDHKLRAIGIENAAPDAVFRLADKQPGDSFTGSASWLRAGYFRQLTEVKTDGGGDFQVALPPGPADHVPLLAGFAFERRPGTDANIRMIAVQLTEGMLRVALVDDQGPDFRGMEQVVAASFGLSGIPIVGGPLASTLTAGMAAQEFVNFDGKRLRTFKVRVQIIWAPRSAVRGMGSVSGMSRRADGGILPSPNDKIALRGFRFYFGNSDHHLGAIAVRLQAPSPEGPIKYQDDGTDDPIAWSVDYAKMQ
ncbi:MULTISPECIES: hypothetical protein [Sphingomonas]|uniref:hypothetical protein n=1 Tax=Sphingomonas TaxID=13687 RepID=UPI0008352DCB|nr:hypothetical protein [Sphingomonas sp. CCH10-B3]